MGHRPAPTVTTILIVDDDPSIRFLLRSILEYEGFTVAEAGNGAAALEAIKSEALPDIVMTDLMMPLMTGVELIGRLRAEARTAKIPIVVVSSNAEAVKNLGVDAIITKPFSAAKLAESIRAVAGHPTREQTIGGVT